MIHILLHNDFQPIIRIRVNAFSSQHSYSYAIIRIIPLNPRQQYPPI
ncbi:hypothetical protein BMETH_1128_1 [methanotrophic bacterial endosymbiont of Bathymodiolus sp.]|nr:hypothetical protein BMETH_1128_1 [methanotrophic bacterial endosymbiont of Bathymodiolus sp.]